MTDISESGIELLPCPLCGDAMVMSRSGRVAEHDDVHQDCPLWITKLYPDGFAAWNRRHPSREEGLREAAEVIERYVIEEQPGDVKTVLARKMAASILALIPTKPEAKGWTYDGKNFPFDGQSALQSKKPE